MSNIKPIETEYKGYRFRSRLEARWAVLFDEAKIPWQYEVEGYELSNGVKYLPDFYLPTFQLYIEIKPNIWKEPNGKEQVEKWEAKCGQSRTDSGKAIMVLYGDPMTELWGRLFAWTTDDLVCGEKGKIEEYTGNSRFIPVGPSEQQEIVILTSNCEKQQICVTASGKTNKKVSTPFMLVWNYWDDAYCLLVQPMYREQEYVDIEGSFDNACKKARQARFEHGESGYKRNEQKSKKKTASPEDELMGKLSILPPGDKKIAQILKECQRISEMKKHGRFDSAPRWAIQLHYLHSLESLGYEYTGTLDWETIDYQRNSCNEVLKAAGYTEIDPVTGLLMSKEYTKEMYRPSNDIVRFIDTLDGDVRKEVVRKFMSPGEPTWEEEIQLLDLYRETGFEPSGTLEAEQAIRAAILKNKEIA